jgi:hypothetical protein
MSFSRESWFRRALLALAVSAPAVSGCEGRESSKESSGADAAAPASEGANAGVCGDVEASEYDQSCSVDSDCVVTVPGSSTCIDPCEGPWFFICPAAVIGADASAAYTAALTAALGATPGLDGTFGCGGPVVSCPPYGVARCEQEKCRFVTPLDDVPSDAGSPTDADAANAD